MPNTKLYMVQIRWHLRWSTARTTTSCALWDSLLCLQLHLVGSYATPKLRYAYAIYFSLQPKKETTDQLIGLVIRIPMSHLASHVLWITSFAAGSKYEAGVIDYCCSTMCILDMAVSRLQDLGFPWYSIIKILSLTHVQCLILEMAFFVFWFKVTKPKW